MKTIFRQRCYIGHPVGDDTVVWVAPSAEIDEAIIKTKSGC